jgi:hypothetical protein
MFLNKNEKKVQYLLIIVFETLTTESKTFSQNDKFYIDFKLKHKASYFSFFFCDYKILISSLYKTIIYFY